MSKRLRLVGVSLHPQFVAVDEETLDVVPLPTQPLNIPAADWPNVVALFEEAMEQLRGQVETAPTEPPHT